MIFGAVGPVPFSWFRLSVGSRRRMRASPWIRALLRIGRLRAVRFRACPEYEPLRGLDLSSGKVRFHCSYRSFGHPFGAFLQCRRSDAALCCGLCPSEASCRHFPLSISCTSLPALHSPFSSPPVPNRGNARPTVEDRRSFRRISMPKGFRPALAAGARRGGRPFGCGTVLRTGHGSGRSYCEIFTNCSR